MPDMKLSVRQVFGIDSDLEVPAYAQSDEHVPDSDPEVLLEGFGLGIKRGWFAAKRHRSRRSAPRRDTSSRCLYEDWLVLLSRHRRHQDRPHLRNGDRRCL